ncbi:MAG: hypothetical protein IJ057_11875 [Bacteroidales bacterium]|nr:hypothetical protein [Bacteroidales bacterium]
MADVQSYGNGWPQDVGNWLGTVPDVYWSVVLWLILLVILAYRVKKDE